jgi:hypothetical protein
MISLVNLLVVIITVMVAVILLWVVSIEIINSKTIKEFLPFFAMSIWLCLMAALNLYAIYDQKIWFAVESFWGIWFLWILIILVKNDNI